MSQLAPRAEIVVDLDAIRHNVRRIREIVAPAEVMVVVKADGYGHGMVPVARAAREAGAAWLGVATLDEAVALRDAGDEGPLLCWLATPGEDHRPAIERGVTVTAYDVDQLEAIARCATDSRPVDVQLKVDTGLHRGGVPGEEWPGTLSVALGLVREGRIRVTGVFSHFACSDEPDHPWNERQEAVFTQDVEIARMAGLDVGTVHLANSAAALLRPSSRFDLVRVGLAAYGLNPSPKHLDTAALGLTPAMTARARLVMVKNVPPGGGVSYGHTWVAEQQTHVGLVPVGYADGIPRHASNAGQVLVRKNRSQVLGRVCMDQFVVDLSTQGGQAGDDVVIFGPGEHGEPTAQEWAEAADTISYEIVARMGGRFVRTYVGEGVS